MIEFAAIVAGWLLITIGITCYFIPSPKIGTVKGEKELLADKERDFRKNFANSETLMLGRMQTNDESKTR